MEKNFKGKMLTDICRRCRKKEAKLVLVLEDTIPSDPPYTYRYETIWCGLMQPSCAGLAPRVGSLIKGRLKILDVQPYIPIRDRV